MAIESGNISYTYRDDGVLEVKISGREPQNMHEAQLIIDSMRLQLGGLKQKVNNQEVKIRSLTSKLDARDQTFKGQARKLAKAQVKVRELEQELDVAVERIRGLLDSRVPVVEDAKKERENMLNRLQKDPSPWNRPFGK